MFALFVIFLWLVGCCFTAGYLLAENPPLIQKVPSSDRDQAITLCSLGWPAFWLVAIFFAYFNCVKKLREK